MKFIITLITAFTACCLFTINLEAKNKETIIIEKEPIVCYIEPVVVNNIPEKEVEIEISLPPVESSEYPEAAEIWNYMKEQNWSDAVCAGILGNMMTESGGQTLNIQWDIYNSIGHYGICQWSPKWYPEVMGVSLLEQLDFLVSTMPNEFKIFGKNYYSNFTLNDFLLLETPEEVADAFAKVYERCGSQSTIKRQESARIAYEYFAQINK